MVNIFSKRNKVQMLKSVAGLEGSFIAGRQYRLPIELADKFIARGYCTGGISPGLSPDETNALRGNSNQEVQL